MVEEKTMAVSREGLPTQTFQAHKLPRRRPLALALWSLGPLAILIFIGSTGPLVGIAHRAGPLRRVLFGCFLTSVNRR